MKIAKVQGNQIVQYPVSMKTEFPDTSFPRNLEQRHLPAGYVIVFDVPRPADTADVRVVGEGAPEYKAGNWQQTWETRATTADEKAEYRRAEQEVIDRAALAADPNIVALRDATPAQIKAYIDQHLANLGTAQGQENLRTDIKTLAVAIGFIARQVFK